MFFYVFVVLVSVVVKLFKRYFFRILSDIRLQEAVLFLITDARLRFLNQLIIFATFLSLIFLERPF